MLHPVSGNYGMKISSAFWVRKNLEKFIDVLTFNIYIYEESLMIMTVVPSSGPDKHT